MYYVNFTKWKQDQKIERGEEPPPAHNLTVTDTVTYSHII